MRKAVCVNENKNMSTSAEKRRIKIEVSIGWCMEAIGKTLQYLILKIIVL